VIPDMRQNDKTETWLTVRRLPGEPNKALLSFGGRCCEAAIGRSGCTIFKREGDGATPVARMAMLYGYYRSDRLARPETRLAMVPTRPDSGWCDESGHAAYNRPVRLPFPGRHERLMRDDGLYDICIVLDWNIRSRQRSRGSAIFFHLAATDFAPTEGCIAVKRADMQWLLRFCDRDTIITVMG